MSDALLRVRGAARVFKMGEVDVPALREVDLEITRGEILVLLGPSGCGKSTLLNLLGGMDQPTQGSVSYRGKHLETMDDTALTRYRRRHVGFVFQFYNLIPSLTAIENVQAAAELSPAPLDPYELMARVGLADRCDHFPSQLSGGEQQRVAIARALVTDPSLLLCDEPTGALDLMTSRRVLRVLVDANVDMGKTVVMVTHNSQIAEIADRVALMRDGKVQEIRHSTGRVVPEDVSW